MGFSLSFDARNAVLRFAFEGCLTDAELFAGYEALRVYAASNPPGNSIVDYSGVTQNLLSTQTIQKLSQMPSAIPKGYLRIHVAPSDVIYGLARMFQILTEEQRPELRVVRSMKEACDLLGVERLEFSSIHLPLADGAAS